jgi:ribonuclease G
MVQVIKDPIGTKGARLSTQISIAGRLLVFLPQDDHIGVSQKIPRTSARRCAAACRRWWDKEGGGGASSCAPMAKDASDAELAEDIAYLRKTWARIKERRAPAALAAAPGPNLLQRVLRDLVGEQTQSIRIDSRSSFAAGLWPGVHAQAAAKLQHYKGERPIFDLYSIDEEIARRWAGGGPEVRRLPDRRPDRGADHHRREHRRLVGARNFDDTIFKTNLEAAQAIARQLRLRNLGGIIIVDFIDMVREDHQQAVLAEFRKQLARDRVKTMAGGFSQLGLVEMTRKRTRESLAHMLCALPACQGKGRSRPRAACYDILRESCAKRASSTRASSACGLAKVVELFLDEESQHLAGCRTSSASPSRCRPKTAWARSSTTLCCCECRVLRYGPSGVCTHGEGGAHPFSEASQFRRWASLQCQQFLGTASSSE